MQNEELIEKEGEKFLEEESEKIIENKIEEILEDEKDKLSEEENEENIQKINEENNQEENLENNIEIIIEDIKEENILPSTEYNKVTIVPEENKEDSMNNAEKEIKTNTINKDNLNFYFKICQHQDFLKKECVPTNYNANMIKMIKQSINEGAMDDILEDVINESKIDISNSYDSIKYHITSSFNQKNKKYDDISVIDLSQCEQKLKEIYKIG